MARDSPEDGALLPQKAGRKYNLRRNIHREGRFHKPGPTERFPRYLLTGLSNDWTGRVAHAQRLARRESFACDM
ncbi:MAG: hypothetical protein PVJ28_10580 [Acidimicrobiia bacterium]